MIADSQDLTISEVVKTLKTAQIINPNFVLNPKHQERDLLGIWKDIDRNLLQELETMKGMRKRKDKYGITRYYN